MFIQQFRMIKTYLSFLPTDLIRLISWYIYSYRYGLGKFWEYGVKIKIVNTACQTCCGVSCYNYSSWKSAQEQIENWIKSDYEISSDGCMSTADDLIVVPTAKSIYNQSVFNKAGKLTFLGLLELVTDPLFPTLDSELSLSYVKKYGGPHAFYHANKQNKVSYHQFISFLVDYRKTRRNQNMLYNAFENMVKNKGVISMKLDVDSSFRLLISTI